MIRMTDFDDTYGCFLLYDPPYLYQQIFLVIGMDRLQSAADGVAVEVLCHGEFSVDEK